MVLEQKETDIAVFISDFGPFLLQWNLSFVDAMAMDQVRTNCMVQELRFEPMNLLWKAWLG